MGAIFHAMGLWHSQNKFSHHGKIVHQKLGEKFNGALTAWKTNELYRYFWFATIFPNTDHKFSMKMMI